MGPAREDGGLILAIPWRKSIKSNLQREVMRLGAVLLVLGALGACCGPWGPGPGPGGGGHGGPGGPGHLQQP